MFGFSAFDYYSLMSEQDFLFYTVFKWAEIYTSDWKLKEHSWQLVAIEWVRVLKTVS